MRVHVGTACGTTSPASITLSVCCVRNVATITTITTHLVSVGHTEPGPFSIPSARNERFPQCGLFHPARARPSPEAINVAPQTSVRLLFLSSVAARGRVAGLPSIFCVLSCKRSYSAYVIGASESEFQLDHATDLFFSPSFTKHSVMSASQQALQHWNSTSTIALRRESMGDKTQSS